MHAHTARRPPPPSAAHTLEDTRHRALSSLRLKLEHGLITVEDIVHETPLLDAGLPYLLPPAGAPPTAAAAAAGDAAPSSTSASASAPSSAGVAPEAAPLHLAATADACFILAALARHPYGHAWLHMRGATARALALQSRLPAGSPGPSAALEAAGPSTAPSVGRAAAGAAAAAAAQCAALVEALLSHPVAEAPLDTAAFLAAMQLPDRDRSRDAPVDRPDGGGDGAGAGAGTAPSALARGEAAAARMAAATSHDEFMEALVELQGLCSEDRAVAVAFASGKWLEPVQKFLEVRRVGPVCVEWGGGLSGSPRKRTRWGVGGGGGW